MEKTSRIIAAERRPCVPCSGLLGTLLLRGTNQKPSDGWQDGNAPFRFYSLDKRQNVTELTAFLTEEPYEQPDKRWPLYGRATVRQSRLKVCKYIYEHWLNIQDLQISSERCPLCQYLISLTSEYRTGRPVESPEDVFVTIGLPKTLDDVESSRRKNWHNYPRELRRRSTLNLMAHRRTTKAFELHDIQVYRPCTDAIFSDALKSASPNLLPLRPIVPLKDEGDLNALAEFVRAQLDNCLQNHEACKSPEPFIPTRVIDVGPSDGLEDPHLHIPTASDRGSLYATLSYCWGSASDTNKNLLTTDHNISLFRERIPFSELPACCRDAVTFTRKLGIRFLWIDALCIIQNQNSKSDWLRESARMAQIYSCSAVTIAAASCNECSSPMIYPRTRSAICIKVDLNGSGQDTTVGFRDVSENLETALGNSSVMARGWTVQERELSPRILYFTQEQVYWTCASNVQSEDGGEEWPESWQEERWPLRRPHFNLQNMERSKANQLILRKQWYQIAGEHTALGFTEVADLLPSLAGLAQAYQKHFDSRYIAGLWECDLPLSLVWLDYLRGAMDAGVIHTARRPEHEQLPSWSWVQTRGHLRRLEFPLMQLEDMTALAQVEYVHIEADDDTAAFVGQVRNCAIGLRGRLEQVWWLQTPKSYCPRAPSVASGRPNKPRGVCIKFPNYRGLAVNESVLRHCWAMQITEDHLLLLEEVDLSQWTFVRIGTAIIPQKFLRILYKDSPEVSIRLI